MSSRKAGGVEGLSTLALYTSFVSRRLLYMATVLYATPVLAKWLPTRALSSACNHQKGENNFCEGSGPNP